MKRLHQLLAVVSLLCIAVGAGARTMSEASGQTTVVSPKSLCFTIDDVATGQPLQVFWNEDTVWVDSARNEQTSAADLAVGQSVTATIVSTSSRRVATRVTIR